MIAGIGIGVRAGRRWLLRDVSLCLEPGTLTALLGPNGAGKTTLLRVLAGGLATNTGSVTLDGEPLHCLSMAGLARRRAVLAQHSAPVFGLSVAETVALGRLAFRYGDDRHHDRAALAAVNARFELDPYWDRPLMSLSGGERQRVQVARIAAQLWRSDDSAKGLALFLDEPVAALDLAQQAHVLRFARDCAARGAAVLAVLHDPNHALDADRVGLLRDGRMLQVGATDVVLTPDRLAECLGVRLQLARKANRETVFVR